MSQAAGGQRLRQALRYLGLAAASLDPRRRPPARPAATRRYSEEELLRRSAEFIRSAEEQWRTMAAEPSGRQHVLAKPFGNVRETAAMLYRLGLVLDVLDLGIGHTVLDFGAGSCWLSVFLNRLRCRTVSVDVSETALALGREAFARDPQVDPGLEPRFLVFDGRRLDLETESVDRVVCFDSFHHVPDQDRALAELHRVLRPGGRLVMAEPGEGHARAEHSRFECSHFGVLENDLDLGELLARARLAGFDGFLSKPYPDAPAITLSAEDSLRLMAGDHSVFPLHELEASLRTFYLLALLKGAPRADSRNPSLLRARLELARPTVLAGRASDPLKLPLRVTNTGDTLWLAGAGQPGHVNVGGHLLDTELRPLERCFFADALPRDVSPGESIDLEAQLYLPARLGAFVLRVDLIDEKVAWFEQCGSATLDVELRVEGWPDSRAPHRFGAQLVLLSAPPSGPVTAGLPLSLRLRAVNSGDTRWLAGPQSERGSVCLGAQLWDAGGSLVERDHFRVELTRAVDPGELVEIDAAVPVPQRAGRYRLRLDLVAEQICWFEHHGSRPLAVDLVVD